VETGKQLLMPRGALTTFSIANDVSASGRDWTRLAVAGSEGDAVTWVTVAVFEEKPERLRGSPGAPRYTCRAGCP
jgi:hypothetical protein